MPEELVDQTLTLSESMSSAAMPLLEIGISIDVSV